MQQAPAPHNEAAPVAPVVDAFFDDTTSTLTYVVSCPDTAVCAVIDPVLDLDYASGTLSTRSADQVLGHITAKGLTLELILETHVHADHLSAAPYLKGKLGGKIGIGQQITTVQATFAEVFNEDSSFARDGSQFDCTSRTGTLSPWVTWIAKPSMFPATPRPAWPIAWVTPCLWVTRYSCRTVAQLAAISLEATPEPSSVLCNACCRILMKPAFSSATTISPTGVQWPTKRR